MELINLTSTPVRYFNILPEDWQDEIVPVWGFYQNDATIWGLENSGEIMAGAIVFTTIAPDVKGYKEVAQKWLQKGYCYLAFLFVKENLRGQGLGSVLVKEIKQKNPSEKYWLAIDDFELTRFYEGLGFVVVEEVKNTHSNEWVLIEKNTIP